MESLLSLRQGSVGQQARDALLLIMSLSASDLRVAQHIAENTYFCPVSHITHSQALTEVDPGDENPQVLGQWVGMHRHSTLMDTSMIADTSHCLLVDVSRSEISSAKLSTSVGNAKNISIISISQMLKNQRGICCCC